MIALLHRIAAKLNLGSVIEPPRQLTGGFMHKMYSLFTERGRFAVKLLNPHIMARPDALDNFRRAEAFEAQLERAGIPILPALVFGNQKMHQLDEQYFYLFDWFEGRALRSEQITEDHCRIIGAQLAKIHRIDLQNEPAGCEQLSIDWDSLIEPFATSDPMLHGLLRRNRGLLYELQSLANAAFPRLPAVSAICHNDMDSKNVLWHGSECRIIDLECLDRSNPCLELYETALYWSGIEQHRLNPQFFDTFMLAYSDAGGTLPPDLTVVHDANAGRLGWLEHNLQRARGVGCSEEEIAVGVSEVRKTLAQLIYYHEIRKHIVH